MSDVCIINNTFRVTSTEHINALVGVMKGIIKDKKISAPALVKKVIAGLSTRLPGIAYKAPSGGRGALIKYNKDYRESITDLGNYILGYLKLQGVYPDGIKQALEKGLRDMANSPFENVNLELTEMSEFDVEGTSEEFSKASSNFFKENSNTSGRYNLLKFKRDFFDDCIIVRKGTPRIITTNNDLNNRIAVMQSKLGEQIKKILPNFNDISLVGKDIDGKISIILPNMNSLLKEAKPVIEELIKNPTFFLRGYQDIMSGIDNPAYDAACAYFSLLHFDDMLQESVGKFISFNSGLKNKITTAAMQKYSFAFDTSHHRHNFSQDADARTVEENTAAFIKLIIETIPISLGVNKVVSRYLSTTALSDSICKLKSLANHISPNSKFTKVDPNNKVEYLQYCLDNYRNDPVSYAHIIFSLLQDPEVQEHLSIKKVDGKSVFTTTDFTIYSELYNYVYADKEGSLRRIVETSSAGSSKVNNFNPVSAISIFFNNCVPINTVDTEIDLEGNVEMKERNKSRLNQGVFFKVDKINYEINKKNLETNENLIKNPDGTKIAVFDDNKLQKVTIKNNDLYIGYNGKRSIFSEGQNFNITISHPGCNTINLTNDDTQSEGTELKKLLESYINGTIDKEKPIVDKLLKFIDDRLSLGITGEDGKLKLKILIENNSELKDIFKDMIRSAVKAQAVLEIRSEKPETSKFKDHLRTYGGFIDNNAFRRNTIKGMSGTIVKIVKAGTNGWLDAWENAELIFKGVEQKSTSKNYFGKNEANYSTSFLGANPRHQARQYFDEQLEIENKLNNYIPSDEISTRVENIFAKYGFKGSYTINGISRFFDKSTPKENFDDADGTELREIVNEIKEEYYKNNYRETAASVNYFTQNPAALGKTCVKTVAKNQFGKPKFIKEMNTGELLYDSFVHNFCVAGRKNEILIQCTTFSDKTKFVQNKIGLNFTISNGKNLNQASVEDIQNEFLNTVGRSVQITLNNTITIYKKLFKEAGYNDVFNTPAELNNVLKKYNSKDILKKLNAAATRLGEKFFVDTHYIITEINFNDGNGSKKVKVLQLNPLLVYQSECLYNDKEVFKARWQKQEELYLRSVLDSGISFKCPDSLMKIKDDSDGEAITSLIQKYPIITGIFKMNHDENVTDKAFYDSFAKNWIFNGQLILGKRKLADGTVVPVTYADKDLTGVELNPLLRKYFALDSFLSANMRLLYTGSELAHPYKKGSKDSKKLFFLGIQGLTEVERKNLNQLAEADDMIGILNYKVSNANAKDQIDAIVHERALNTENALQGIQLKRNVIIPATMQYINPNMKNGVGQTTKVAIIKDIPAKVWEYTGKTGEVDSMDGSALTCPLQSILENNSLGPNAVGHDKKPIWQSYDSYTNSATLVKFASFEMTNQRLRDSIMSDVSLLPLLKRMYGLSWSGHEWSKKPILCGNTGYLDNEKVKFVNMTTNGKNVIYEDANGKYKIIKNLTYEYIDPNDTSKGFVYKTIEHEAADMEYGSEDLGEDVEVYHIFDKEGNHKKLVKEEFESQKANLFVEGNHTINSLYELWETLGGCYTVEATENGYVPSETSHIVLANYVNSISIRTFSDKSSLGKTKTIQELHKSQEVYVQPLKDMFIGYLANTSAVKNGQANVNEDSAWYGNQELSYMTLDNTNLGIQMDADHEMANSEMTEFSQVITALEANGRTHGMSREIYHTLGKIAYNASKLEIETLDLYKQNSDLTRNKIYDILAKTIIDHVKMNGGRVSLAEMLIQRLESKFGHHLTEHDKDAFKMPFSDANIYSQILPTFASNINSKSIKRKFPGSGCVMCPGYNIMQVFKFRQNDGSIYTGTASDILKLARQEAEDEDVDYDEIYKEAEAKNDNDRRKALIKWYLNRVLVNPNQDKYPVTLEDFAPTDIIDIRDSDNKEVATLSLEDIEVYYEFIKDRGAFIRNYLIEQGKDPNGPFYYRHSVTKPRNLAPARITWKYNNKRYNVFELNVFRECFEVEKQKVKDELTKLKMKKLRLAVQRQFDALAKGQFFIDGYWDDENKIWVDGTSVKCEELKNEPAELVVSNMYAEKFGIGNMSVGELLDAGQYAFMIEPSSNVPQTKFDLCFRKTAGENVLVTFDKVNDDNASYKSWERKDLVYKNNVNGTIEVYLKDRNGNPKMQVGRLIPNSEYKYDEENKCWILADGTKVDPKITRNLRNLKSGVYEYKEFISKYESTQVDRKTNFGDVSRPVTVYKINKKSIIDSLVFVDGIKDSEKAYQINTAIAKRIEDLYKSENFLGIEVSHQLTYSSAATLIPIFEHMDYNENWRDSVGIKISDIIKKRLEEIKKAAKDEKSIDRLQLIDIVTDNNIDAVEDYYRDYYDKNAMERFNSWKASLYFTAARIPAQSHQSFMLMKTVAYSGSDKNICYVSHWQTFLQGSDYDIDKAYLMGCNIGADGRYTKWSDLFDYSTEESLRASQRLPTVNKCDVYFKDGFNMSEFLENYDSNWDNSQKLNWMADVLTELEDYRRKNGDEYAVHIKDFDNDEVKNMIRKHYATQLSDNILDAAYKNYVSSNIQNVILNPRNFISAYTPISMDDLQDASADSAKAQVTKSLNLMNPATKWIMQTQNMTGKTVIGITAVGEKIYFNMSFLWNEAIQEFKKGNNTPMKYMKFTLEYNRIQGRYNGNVKKRIISALSDVNIDGLSADELRELFSQDVLLEYSAMSGLHKDPADFTFEDFYDMLHSDLGADIMISQLLSAATDNAKELILEKINCDSNFAKYYLHLIMMGFDIKDCVKFMTSGAVETVSELMKTNFYDSSLQEVPMWMAISEAKFKVNPNNYIEGFQTRRYDEEDFDYDDEGSSKPSSNAQIFLNKIKNDNDAFENYLEVLSSEQKEIIETLVYGKVQDPKGKKDKPNPITQFMIMLIISNNPQSISSVIDARKLTNDELNCINRIDYIINKVRSRLSDDYDIFDYLADIDEFSKLDELANETSSVGNTFLGLNQGIPTDKESLLSKMNMIERMVKDREKKLIPNARHLGTNEPEGSDKIKFFEKNGSGEDIVSKISAHSGIDKWEVKRILEQAIAYGICGDFDAEKWLYNEPLNSDTQVNKYVKGSNKPIGIQPTSYRKLTMEYYNLLKLTWNPFYAMKELPQFAAIIDLLAAENMYDVFSSAKSNIINAINKDLISHGVRVKKDDLSKFRPYADKLLLDGFLNDNPVLFKLPAETEYFTIDGKVEKSQHPVELNLSLYQDRISLKKYVEDILIPNMKSDPEYRDMKLIKDLSIGINKDGSSSLSVPIDLSDPYSSLETTKTFAEYQKNISDLGLYKVPENEHLKIADILMLYNLIVNCNKYGSNRLTGLFLSYVLYNRDSLLQKYYQWLGNFDFNTDEGVLTFLNYDRTDALIEIAERVRENNLEGYNKDLIAKVYDKDKGRYIYKKCVGKNTKSSHWEEVSYYGNKKLSSLTEDEMNVFTLHWVNMLPMATVVAQNYVNIEFSDKISDIMQALRYFQDTGKLVLIKENCE